MSRMLIKTRHKKEMPNVSGANANPSITQLPVQQRIFHLFFFCRSPPIKLCFSIIFVGRQKAKCALILI